MAEREPNEKVGHIFGRGRNWRNRINRSLTRHPHLAPRLELAARLGILTALSLAVALLLSPPLQKPWTKYREGTPARETVRAVGSFLVQDVETLAQRQKETLAQVPPVFDLDEGAVSKVEERLHQSLEFIRQKYQEIMHPPPATAKSRRDAQPAFNAVYKEILKQKPEFERLLGVSLPNPTFYLLAKNEFSPTLENLATQILRQFFQQGLISARSLPNPEPKEISLRRLPSRQEQLFTPPYPFMELEDIRKPVANYCREVAVDFTPADRFLVCDLVQYLLLPNVSPNLAETQTRQQARLDQLKPTFFQVQKKELIVQEGEILTPLHVAKLKAHALIYPQNRGIIIFFGTFLTVALVLGISYRLALGTFKSFSPKLRDLSFLAVLLVSGTYFTAAVLGLGDMVSRTRPEIGAHIIYALPLAVFPTLAALFLGLETGVIMAFLMATLGALLLHKSLLFFLYFLTAGMVGAWGMRRSRRRGSLVHTGLAVSLVNLAMLTAFKLMDFPFTAKELFIGQAFALTGGLLTGILTLGLSPAIEVAFGYTSNIRHLEILNLDQPILRELMLIAPGTYHHSLVVGQMVEAAAEAIGANPLLAKAAAYYHDIGKIRKPAYFVENQLGEENKHEKLAPSMSSLILIAHVKDGVELVRQHRLGEPLVQIIQQHHGTCTISYFYHKAKAQAANPDQVNIEDFRYPGPRPQTKEAGLVLLGDQVEAASRTLVDPTPARVQGLVQKIINNVFSDGQLDECDLTLKELHLIAKSFNKILNGIFHQRVHYPQPAEKTKTHEDLDKQPAKKSPAKSGEDKGKSREDLKRLGMP